MFEGALQPMHWLVILLLVLVLFGGKKLPELGKGLGQAIRGFKEGMRDESAPPADRPASGGSGPTQTPPADPRR